MHLDIISISFSDHVLLKGASTIDFEEQFLRSCLDVVVRPSI